jgi:hypothetical protein
LKVKDFIYIDLENNLVLENKKIPNAQVIELQLIAMTKFGKVNATKILEINYKLPPQNQPPYFLNPEFLTD